MINMETEGNVQCPLFTLLSNSEKSLEKRLAKSRHWCLMTAWSLPEVTIRSSLSRFMEPKDKAALFKGYQACLFSSRVGGSFYIVDYRNAAWWNVPVKLPECTALNTEEFPHDQTSHSCHEHLLKVLTAFSAWIRRLILRWEWECKIRLQRLQKSKNRSQMESHCQRALPVGTPSCLDGRSDLKRL